MIIRLNSFLFDIKQSETFRNIFIPVDSLVNSPEMETQYVQLHQTSNSKFKLQD